MYSPQLKRLITEAITHLHTEMNQAAPQMAGQVWPWMKQLAGSAQPANYFMHPLAFPALLLPWWVEQTLRAAPNLSLQADLAYSTINGYYHIRLIDNLMDGHATVELQLLPALNFFHTQFQSAYQPHFPADHSFWDFFKTTWFHSAEAAMADAGLSNITETQFKQIAAQKICAAKIPVAAICYIYDCPDCIEPWSQWVDLLGCWHQMLNDVFDWHKDLTHQTPTYFLAQAERCRKPDESVLEWVAREGFAWAVEKLEAWMLALKTLTGELHSLDLLDYLITRETMLHQQKDDIAKGLESLAKIAATKYQ